LAAALIPLKTLDIASYLADVKSLKSQAKGYSGYGPKLPGVPDLKSVAKKMIDAEKDGILDKARAVLIPVLVTAMAAGAEDVVKLIPEINKMIRALNKIVTAIITAVVLLMAAAVAVFVVITAVVIIAVVTKIITLIPSLVVAWGAGVSFDVPKAIAGGILSVAASLLQELMPIAFKIIAVLMMILKLYGLMLMVMGMLKMFMQGQTDSAKTAEGAFNKTADDWGISTGDDLDGAGVGSGGTVGGELVECTLPSGEVLQMTAAACMALGGTFPGMDMLGQLNGLDNQISDLTNMLPVIDPNLCWSECQHGLDLDGTKLITCQLPDGTNSDITLGECDAVGGLDLSVASLNGLLSGLQSERDTICFELGDLCDYQLGEFVITSLMNPHDGVTIEKATFRTGKRRGFYQSETDTGLPLIEDDQLLEDDTQETLELPSGFNFDMENLSGCTDISADNYEPSAALDDGSCEYYDEEL
jgi:hypothetical protein